MSCAHSYCRSSSPCLRATSTRARSVAFGKFQQEESVLVVWDNI